MGTIAEIWFFPFFQFLYFSRNQLRKFLIQVLRLNRFLQKRYAPITLKSNCFLHSFYFGLEKKIFKSFFKSSTKSLNISNGNSNQAPRKKNTVNVITFISSRSKNTTKPYSLICSLKSIGIKNKQKRQNTNEYAQNAKLELISVFFIINFSFPFLKIK